jgi:photosystem II stability/assembly factor-like uncharacterized protein
MVLVILASVETTMSILTRPRPPRADERSDAEALEALIEEARQRARRRRRGYAASALVAAAAGLLGFYGFNGGGATRPQARAEPPRGGEAAAAPSDAARWPLQPGLEGGAITGLALDPQDPNTVFATTLEAGVFKSGNGGRTWRLLDLAPGVSRVDALAMAPGDPKTLYVGTGRGVFKTTDGGANWQATSSDLLANETAEERDHRSLEGYVYALAVDRRDRDIVYAGTWEKGVFKTTDGGASWRSIGLEAVSPLALDPRDPETIYAGAVGGLGPTGVFKSSDGGASWHLVGLQGTTVGALALDPQHPETIYAGTDGKGVFKTTDGGASWGAAGLEGRDISGLILNPKNPQNVYAESKGRIFASTNGGRSWRALNAGWVPGTWPTALALNPRNPATVYVGTITAVDGKGDVGAGVFKSVDGGNSWRPMNAGLTDARVSALALDPRRPGTAYASIDGRGVFKREDGRWRAANTGLTSKGVHAVAVDPQEPANVYAVTDGGLFKSTTGGAGWRHLPVPTTDNSTVAIDPQDPSTVYAITNDDGDDRSEVDTRVFRSDDGGATWRLGGDVQKFPAPGAPDYGFPIFPLAIDPLDPETLYAGGLGVFKSTDGGTTWRSVGLARTPVGALATDPKEPAIVYAGTDAGLFKSTDAGATWQALHGPLDDVRVEALAIEPRHRQTVYAGTDRGVVWTADGGHSWRQFKRLPLRTFDALAVDPAAGIVYAGAYGGGIFELRPGH